MRDFLDNILMFIGSETLTDEEFELIALSQYGYDKPTFDELRLILEMRDGVTDSVVRLRAMFMAKGTDLSDPNVSLPTSNILIGRRL